MNSKLNWDDLKLALAIGRSGSLSGAGRDLGVSHATVFRRLGEIEQRLGVALFQRSRSGYAPTLAGEEIIRSATDVEASVFDVERRVMGQDLRPSGTVRLTTTDTLLHGLLSPLLCNYRDSYPDISLEIVVSNQVFDLTRREADIALRPASAPPETLVGRKIATIAQAIYGHHDLADGLTDIEEARNASWIGPDERMAYGALDKWYGDQGINSRCHLRTDTMLGMFAAARDGLGLAVLPCYLADRASGLTRIGDPIPSLATDLWLLTHPDLRHTARIRAVLDFIATEVRKVEGRLTG